MIELKTRSEIDRMHVAGRFVAAVLTFAGGAGLHFGLYKPTGVSARAQAAFTKAA